MKERKNRLIGKIVLFGAVYTIGVLMAFLLYLFRALGIIRILHWERFPRRQGNLIVVSNHPSLVEPILILALFFRDYLVHPFKFSPWSTPDKINYYDKWYWFWLRPRTIPIDRSSVREELKAFFQMKKIVGSRGILVFFPEGGRTFKGKEFFHSEKKRKKLRLFKQGVGWLILRTNALVLPIWVDGTEEFLPNLPNKLYHTFPRFWKKITIKIGEPLRFQKSEVNSREGITQKLITTLLNLADEEK